METENTNTVTNEEEYVPLHKSYCRECGSVISAKAETCPKCGASQNQTTVKSDEASTGLKVVSFLIPLVGLILYIMQNKDTPNAAKEYGKWALIGFAVCIVMWIIGYFITLSSMTTMFNSIF